MKKQQNFRQTIVQRSIREDDPVTNAQDSIRAANVCRRNELAFETDVWRGEKFPRPLKFGRIVYRKGERCFKQ